MNQNIDLERKYRISRGTWIAASLELMYLGFLILAVYLYTFVMPIRTIQQIILLSTPIVTGLVTLAGLILIRRGRLTSGPILTLLGVIIISISGVTLREGVLGVSLSLLALISFSLIYLVMDPPGRKWGSGVALAGVVVVVALEALALPIRSRTQELVTAAPFITGIALVGFIVLLLRQSQLRVLPIGARIAGGFMAMLLLTVTLGVIVSNSLNFLGDTLQTITSTTQKTEAAIQVKSELWRMKEAVSSILASESPEPVIPTYVQRRQFFLNVFEEWKALENAPDSPLISELQGSIDSLDVSIANTISLVRANDLSGAVANDVSVSAPLVEKTSSLLSTYIADNQEILRNQQASLPQLQQNTTWTITTLVSFSVITGIVLVVTLGRTITNSLNDLVEVTQKFGAGDRSVRAVEAPDEVGILAAEFNSTITHLNDLYSSLEQRVLDRTRALQTSVEVGRRISTILDENALAKEVVDQVQRSFNYYHTQIYFYDEKNENLVMAGGTGEAGAQMLARHHQLPKGRGLVGRAATTNTVVLVPDVYKDTNWLPNPLLPDTKSELAIPISAGEVVLGVLDVQQNITQGLSQEDVTLLQSLASQVAVALQNARAYTAAQRLVRQEVLLNTIVQKIQTTTSMDKALQTAARELGRALGSRSLQVKLTPPGSPANGGKE